MGVPSNIQIKGSIAAPMEQDKEDRGETLLIYSRLRGNIVRTIGCGRGEASGRGSGAFRRTIAGWSKPGATMRLCATGSSSEQQAFATRRPKDVVANSRFNVCKAARFSGRQGQTSQRVPVLL